MSFEAVPCMFKSRQEDGAEQALFGLLIRPSAATASSSGSTKQLALATTSSQSANSAGNSSADSTTAATITTALSALAGPCSSFQQFVSIADAKRESPSKGQRTVLMSPPAQQMVQLQSSKGAAGPFALLAPPPPGMPPILPRPKQLNRATAQPAIQPKSAAKAAKTGLQQQQTPTSSSTSSAAAVGTFEAAQSPSQVVPQLAVLGQHQQDISSLSIATNGIASVSSLPGPPSTPVGQQQQGLLAIQSPNEKEKKRQQKTASTAKDGGDQLTPTERRLADKCSGGGGGNSKRRRQKQQQQLHKQKAENHHQKTMEEPPPPLQQQHHHQDGLEDLHSIDFSQLVNSTVITTEDYLPSQSEPPIYTNLDMYGPEPGPYHQQPMSAGHPEQQHGPSNNNGMAGNNGHPAQHMIPTGMAHQQRQQHYSEAQHQQTVPVPAVSHHQQQPTALCPSAIYLHNQQHPPHASQHQLQHFAGPSTSSVAASGGQCQVRFMGPGPAIGQHQQHQQLPPPQQYMQQQTSNQQQQPPAGWHPYLMAHPGGSHISSTPDSGIQSIDGSPPSVYTPPMVSPYASQVRSCESVGATTSGGGGTLLAMGHHPPCYAAAASTSSNGAICNGDSAALLLMAPTMMAGGGGGQTQPPRLTGHSGVQQQLGSGYGYHQMDLDSNGDEGANDFSDMPKLVPVTHSEHDDPMEAEESSREMPPPQTSSTSSTSSSVASTGGDEEQQSSRKQRRKRRSPSSSSTADSSSNGINSHETREAARKSATPSGGELLIRQGMSLQELAECISSSIPPEKLKQLTSLIQSKATGGKGGIAANRSRAESRQRIAEQHQQHTASAETTTLVVVDNDQQPSTSSSLASQQRPVQEQLKPTGKRTPRREKMVVTARQPELKAKCEKLATKVQQSKEAPASNGGIKRKAEDQKRKRKEEGGGRGEEESGRAEAKEEEAEEEQKQQQQQLQALSDYRQQVRAQLSRKLDAFMGQVCQQLDDTHLNIHDEHWAKHWPLPWRRLDWQQVHRRVASQRAEEQQQKAAKKRGRRKKKAEEEVEEEKKMQKDEEEVDDDDIAVKMKQRKSKEDRKDVGRKRKVDDTSGDSSQLKRNRKSLSREGRKQGKEVGAQKQKTSPLLPKLHKEKKGARTGEAKAAIGSQKTKINSQKKKSKHRTNGSLFASPALLNDVGHQKLSTSSALKAAVQRKEMPLPPALTDHEVAVVRADHRFLLRNLKASEKWRRKTEEEGVIRAKTEEAATSLSTVLRHILAQFNAICRQIPLLSRRQISHHLERPILLLLQNAAHPSVPLSTAQLLDRFDTLAKQFISLLPDGEREDLHAEYRQLKRSANLARVQPPLSMEQFQEFTEDRRRSLSSGAHHQLVPSTSSANTSSNNKRDGGGGVQQRPLTVDTTLDLSYLDSPHPVGSWDADKAATLSPSSDNRDHDCVRCICGMAEDDGVMTQCDRCNFWLHADCLDNGAVPEDQEFVCDFCLRQLQTTPRVDIVLKPQPAIKLSGCTYYRTLVNSRGLQVRLNEALYVDRHINDKHKTILRELHEECVRKQQISGGPSPGQSPVKQQQRRRDTSAGSSNSSGVPKSGRRKTMDYGNEQRGAKEAEDDDEQQQQRQPNRWWPEEEDVAGEEEGQQQQQQCSEEKKFHHRRDLRVFRVERLFISPNGQRFIFGCYYARPHETFCDSSRMFYRNELFWTPLFDTLPLDFVVGRCLILEPSVWAQGRPKAPRYLEDDVYVCEYQIDRNQRSFEKILPKNRYYINTEPYVFNQFPERLRMKRDFTPFKLTSMAESANKDLLSSSTTEPTMQTEEQEQHPLNRQKLAQQTHCQSAKALQRQLFQTRLEAVCQRILRQHPAKETEDE